MKIQNIEYLFDFNNPLFLPALIMACTSLILVFINFLLYLINRKTLSFLYKKPKISIQETIEDYKKDIERNIYKVNIQVFNPSSFGNHIFVELKNPKIPRCCIFSSNIWIKTVPSDTKLPDINAWHKLPEFGRRDFHLNIKDEKFGNLTKKWLYLITEDIRGKKTRKRFKFKDYLKKER